MSERTLTPAMNAELKTRRWHGMKTELAYTWSKQMDEYFGESGESDNAGVRVAWQSGG